MTWIQRTALAFLGLMWLVFTLLAVLMLITSFRAIREVAVTVGAIDADLAWTIPLIYDALIIICSLAVNVLALWGRWHPFPLAVLTAATVLSTTANLAHAQGNSLLAHAIAATPPVGAFLTVELGAFLTRRVVAYWHLTPAHDTAPAPRKAPASAPARPALSLRTLAYPAVVIVVALTVAVAFDWLSMWTAVALGGTASVGAAVRLRRRQSPRQALSASRPEPVREVVPDGSAEALTAPAQQQEPGSRRGPTAEPDQVWDQITAYLRSKDGTKPTQRELAAELRRSRTSISEAIQAHRPEWDNLTATASSSADGSERPVAQHTGA